MAARQRDWARRTREKLLQLLGGRCAWCGTTESLTLDVIAPDKATRNHHRVEWSHRMSIYRQQFAIGNLQCLCNSCNATKGSDVIRFVTPELKWDHLGQFQPF